MKLFKAIQRWFAKKPKKPRLMKNGDPYPADPYPSFLPANGADQGAYWINSPDSPTGYKLFVPKPRDITDRIALVDGKWGLKFSEPIYLPDGGCIPAQTGVFFGGDMQRALAECERRNRELKSKD